ARHPARGRDRFRGRVRDPARARARPPGAGGRGRCPARADSRHARAVRTRAAMSLWDLYTTNAIWHWAIVVLAMVLLVFVLLTGTAYTVFFERVAIGRIQRRPGPNRVGPHGLLQMAADGVKLVFKESFIPADVDRLMYVIAPAIAVTAAFLAWAVIPVGIWNGFYYWI